MANGASRIFNIMKHTADYSYTPTEYIVLAVKTLNPLTFILDDRVVITKEFYQLDKNFNKSALSIGSKVNSIVLNDNQTYYILGNINYQPQISTINTNIGNINTDIGTINGQITALQGEIEDLKRRVKALEDAQ